jgi:DNA replication protein DnaC
MTMQIAKTLMVEMKLKGMMYAVDRIVQSATQDNWSHSELIDALIQSEYEYKTEKKIENKIKTAKLKLKPEIEDFDNYAKRSITKTQFKELIKLKWISQGRALILIGQTGVGKTFIAQALALHACRNHYSTLFMSITQLNENLMLARSSNSYLKFKEKLDKTQLIVIDDFGLRKLNSVQAQDLCEIIEDRNNDSSIIITTQLPLTHWNEVIDDTVIKDAIIDRLMHTSIIIEIKGESYRKIKGQNLTKEDK